MLWLWKNANLEAKEETLGLDNFESVLLNSYKSLQKQLEFSREMQDQFTDLTLTISDDMQNRIHSLEAKYRETNLKPRNFFWWKFSKEFDEMIKLEIYLRSKGHMCW